MAFHVYVHDQGEVEFVYSFDTRAQARAAIRRYTEETEDHPSHYSYACPWFSISTEPPYQETYAFPDMSGIG